VKKVQFHPSIEKLQVVSSSDDGTVRVWDLIMKSSAARFEIGRSQVLDFVFTSDSKTLVVTSQDDKVSYWSL